MYRHQQSPKRTMGTTTRIAILEVVRRFPVIAIGLVFAVSCGRSTPVTGVPASTAYSDGFEVVVYDVDVHGAVSNVRSLSLREAEKAVAAGAKALLPNDTSSVEQKLATGKPGDSHASMTVKQLDGGKQQVRVSFHESSSTFVYEYVVDGSALTPVSSEYRDLAKSQNVRYTHE